MKGYIPINSSDFKEEIQNCVANSLKASQTELKHYVYALFK